MSYHKPDYIPGHKVKDINLAPKGVDYIPGDVIEKKKQKYLQQMEDQLQEEKIAFEKEKKVFEEKKVFNCQQCEWSGKTNAALKAHITRKHKDDSVRDDQKCEG